MALIDPLAILTVIVVSTSILLCLALSGLLIHLHPNNRSGSPFIWKSKLAAIIFAIFNAVALFGVFRTDLSDFSCNALFFCANLGSHGVNAFVEAVWLFQVYAMYDRSKLLAVICCGLFFIRVAEGLADTALGLGYIDPAMGCSFVQDKHTGMAYEITDLIIDFFTTILIGIYVYSNFKKTAAVKSAGAIYASVAMANLTRNVFLTAFNVVITIILFIDHNSPLVVPLFQFQLVVMFGLTFYERDLVTFFNAAQGSSGPSDKASKGSASKSSAMPLAKTAGLKTGRAADEYE